MSLDVADLYRRYGDLVMGRCRTLLGDEESARDATQEVFLRLHRYRKRFRGEASPSTYLFHITTTTCLNRLRSRKRHPEDPVGEVPIQAYNDTLLETIQLRDLLARVLSHADKKTRAIILYHYADGMTYKEIGSVMGLSGAAIRKRVAVFRQGLVRSPPPWLEEAEL